MTKKLILIPGLFALGITVGIALMYYLGNENRHNAAEPLQTSDLLPVEADDHPMASAFVITQKSDSERIQALEQHIHSLNIRIEDLERVSESINDQDEINKKGALTFDSRSTVDTPVSSLNPAVTTDNLVKAGIDMELAADIVRRRNEIDLKLLELRDRASRQGYFGTERYAEEMQELRDQSPSLRDEIGDEYYDNYLFTTRQNNRVRAVSVMMGSPAELSGMKDGDLILNYDNRQLFNWNELQDATSKGERGEYVNVTVMRNGQLHNLWIPRGPLGIRLGAVRVKP